ncbi:MAG: carboxylating nicotinate-nucleotide diphosphorylase [bacterium]
MSVVLSRDADRLIRAALREDVGTGDITTRLTVPADLTASARIVARGGGVAAGIAVCGRVFMAVDARARFKPAHRDGTGFSTGDVLAFVRGPARGLLTAERTALNFLQRLSGIATLTRRYVDAISNTKAILLDTRKTAPGWRELEKYAVRCGGGRNHRRGLHDMVLIKDNHIAAAGSIPDALARCRGTRAAVEIEVRTLAELDQALACDAGRILLDNMTLAQLRRAVALNRGRARLEASGGINLRRIRRVAATGVDFISVGAITQSAPAADIAFDFDAVPRAPGVR